MVQDKAKRFLFTPYSNDSNNPFTVYGLVSITPEYARTLLSMTEAVKMLRGDYPDEGVFKITAFNYHVTWLEPGRDEAERRATDAEQRETDELIEQANDFDNNMVEVTEGQADLLKNVVPLCRMETCTLAAYDTEVTWSGVIKHTSVELTSPRITVETLQEIANSR